MTMTPLLFSLLTVQTLLGAFDNFWHHELHARLPQRISARRELQLHAAREAIYGVLFAAFAWLSFQGLWAVLIAALLVGEAFITLADFLEEDRSRRLPPFERALHTILTVSYGLLLGLLAPGLWSAAQQTSSLALAYHGLWSWFFSLSSLGVLMWSVRNILAVRHLARLAEPTEDAPATVPQAIGRSTVLVTGGTGFVGSALVRQLVREGRRVIVLSRDPVQARALLGRSVWVVEQLDDIPAETRIDAIVNLAGASILGAPWTKARRRVLVQSRLRVLDSVQRLIERLEHRPEVLVAASAVGYYGLRSGNTVLTEIAAADPGRFQSDLCVAIETAARRAEALGTRVACLRPGIVLGHDGGAYPLQALAARLGLGAILGTGSQPMPWIHLDDVTGLIRHAISEPALHGPFNAVAPERVTQAAFTRALAASFGRRAFLHMPAWPLRRLLGEMSELLLDGQNVAPLHAQASGYRYTHATLEGALASLAR